MNKAINVESKVSVVSEYKLMNKCKFINQNDRNSKKEQIGSEEMT